MTYLLTQMFTSLVLAAIAAGALGWLAHRYRTNSIADELTATIQRQKLQATQAESEIAMMRDDFAELQQRYESELETLSADAKQVPVLQQNLEKSQLLVKQMMQKHEAKITELTEENSKLSHRIKDISQREQALNNIQAEIAIERRRTSKAAEGESIAAAVAATTGLLEGVMASDDSKAEEPKNSSFDFDVNLDYSEPDSEQEEDNTAKTESAEVNNDAEEQSKAEVKAKAKKSKKEPVEPIFTPVDQHDDLKQIFGIGPVTEKTLNKLGITSYSQLAELKQHDIDKIAEALQIFPGRIERDNWVGGARRQLEEVLEGL